MVSSQYFLQHLNSYHAVCVNIFILNPGSPWLFFWGCGWIVGTVIVLVWLLNGGRSLEVEVEGAVCSGCEVIHSVVCWLETPRRSAPLRDRWPLPARPSLDSATLLASPPLRLSLFHPLLSSPSVSSTARRAAAAHSPSPSPSYSYALLH